MICCFKILLVSSFVGLVTSLITVGGVGLLTGIPLAFLEILPGDDAAELRQLPRNLFVAGIGGFVIGWLGGVASQLTGRRINSVISTLLVSTAAILTISWTHPGVNLNINPGWLDYLESYRLTLLAALGSSVAIVGLGFLLRPFLGRKSES